MGGQRRGHPLAGGTRFGASWANQIQGSEGPTEKGGGVEDISSRGYRSRSYLQLPTTLLGPHPFSGTLERHVLLSPIAAQG